MGGKSSPPPPPDYSGIAAASEKQAEYSFQLGKEQLAWAKEQYASDKATTDQVVGSALRSMEFNQGAAERDRARYEQIYQPLESALVKDALSYSSPERKDLEVGAAQAAVGQQFEAARQAQVQALESFGVDPSSARYGALDIGVRTQQAAAQAAAGTQASRYVDATGRALRSEALNIGKGYPGQIAGAYGTSIQAGGMGANTTLGQTASGANTMGTGLQWGQQGTNALGTWANALNMGYNNQLAAWKAENDSGGGWGSIAGAVVGGAMKFLEDGGPVEGGTPGGEVPVQASPTSGAVPDDVPARLTAGEFVIPKDVVDWVGQKGVHQMIEKARKEAQELPRRTGAIPSEGNAPAEAPAFTSRPAAIGG